MQRPLRRIGGYLFLIPLMAGCSAGSQVERAPALELAGTSWVVRSVDDGGGAVQLRDGAAATLEFSPQGTVAGSTSCNRYSGTYTSSGSDLRVGDVAMTRRACFGNFMQQEQKFLRALARVGKARLEGEALQLLSSDGAVALQATREAAD